MQAMLIEDDPATRTGTAAALSRAGFAVTVAGSVDAAKAAVRRGNVDVLVMAERVGGRLAHDVALLAEFRNPGLGTILLSDRTADEADEIFALLPSLHAVLGRSTPPQMLTHLALAAARWQGHDAPAVPPPVPLAVPPHADEASPAPQAVAPVEAPTPVVPDAAQAEPASAQPLTQGLGPVAPPTVTSTPAASRVMPPPVPAPGRVPSFLRMAGLTLASQVQAAPSPTPLPAQRSKAPVRRLHLA